MEFANSATELRRKQCGMAETYTLRKGETTNGKSDWISSDGKKSIWYSKSTTMWMVGFTNKRGIDDAELLSPVGYSSPVGQSMKWMWTDNYNGGKWSPYTTDIRVICSNGK